MNEKDAQSHSTIKQDKKNIEDTINRGIPVSRETVREIRPERDNQSGCTNAGPVKDHGDPVFFCQLLE
jgi:hypothetical protein